MEASGSSTAADIKNASRGVWLVKVLSKIKCLFSICIDQITGAKIFVREMAVRGGNYGDRSTEGCEDNVS